MFYDEQYSHSSPCTSILNIPIYLLKNKLPNSHLKNLILINISQIIIKQNCSTCTAGVFCHHKQRKKKILKKPHPKHNKQNKKKKT